ncbi:hypothetical protein INT47_012305 [Mucor saturninus]|uniref:Uncharacterized protein n=1 Tax=Mucor saturninus TaxID=64648 RepID=A0A8H7QGL4_9FUNG|nr:hypothetical protein INT47_012305 [Mucor saturninus]
MKDVMPEYHHNISRIFLKVGRMGPEERRHRARYMQAEAISTDALEQMIETVTTDYDDRSVYVVSSFLTSGVNYNVVVGDFQMMSCS